MTDALIGVAHRVAMECDLIYSRRNGHTPLIVDMWIRIHFLGIRIQQLSQSGSGFSGKKNSCGTFKLAEVDPHQNRKKKIAQKYKKNWSWCEFTANIIFSVTYIFPSWRESECESVVL